MNFFKRAQLKLSNEEDAMTSVYNLLREACGISQAEAADHVHETRLDTVKSWSSDRRPAPGWAINQLQSLSRRIRRAGRDYAELIKKTSRGNTFLIGLAHDDADARALGFPSTAAQLQAIATAISLLPDDAEIRLVPRVRGDIPAPILEVEKIMPTQTDSNVLAAMQFDDGKFYTAGNLNRRKYERLEDIGWVKGVCTNISDVAYYLTAAGQAQRSFIEAAEIQRQDGPNSTAGGFQTVVRSQPSGHPFITLAPGEKYQPHRRHQPPFLIETIDENVVTARLSGGEHATLYAASILLP